MEVRVDHILDLCGLEAAEPKLGRKRLLRSLLGQLEREHALDVLEVEAGVVEDQSLGVLDKDAVDGKAHRSSHVDVPEHL